MPGGDTRQASEWAGIRAAADLGLPRPTMVLLHDAARPFLTLDLIDRLLDGDPSAEIGAIPAHPVTDALVDDTGRLVDQVGLVRVQTPQAFSLDVLIDRYPTGRSRGVLGGRHRRDGAASRAGHHPLGPQ